MIYDDVINKRPTRRGQPSWHTLEGIGLPATNDAIMFQFSLFSLLSKHFGGKECYTKLLELFHEHNFNRLVGQSEDLQISKNKVDSFKMDTYKTMIVNKSARYSYYLPVELAMSMAGYKDAEAFRQAQAILLEIGQFSEVQNDVLKCFGDAKITGTDIQENKCTWLAAVAMEKSDHAQRSIMLECYGSSG